MEYTYIMIKPDGMKEHIFYDVINRIKDEGFHLVDLAKAIIVPQTLKEHYSHLLSKPFYQEIEDYMVSGPVFTMIVKGDNAVKRMREIIGATDPKEAEEGTIRAMYGNKEVMTYNVIHGSDSPENGLIEIDRFFGYDKETLDKMPNLNFDEINFLDY